MVDSGCGAVESNHKAGMSDGVPRFFQRRRREMKVPTFFAVAACLVSVAGATLLHGAADDQTNASKAALEQQLNETLKTRAESAQRACEAMQAAFEAETVTLDTL